MEITSSTMADRALPRPDATCEGEREGERGGGREREGGREGGREGERDGGREERERGREGGRERGRGGGKFVHTFGTCIYLYERTSRHDPKLSQY